jgi:hypothetical protein
MKMSFLQTISNPLDSIRAKANEWKESVTTKTVAKVASAAFVGTALFLASRHYLGG